MAAMVKSIIARPDAIAKLICLAPDLFLLDKWRLEFCRFHFRFSAFLDFADDFLKFLLCRLLTAKDSENSLKSTASSGLLAPNNLRRVPAFGLSRSPRTHFRANGPFHTSLGQRPRTTCPHKNAPSAIGANQPDQWQLAGCNRPGSNSRDSGNSPGCPGKWHLIIPKGLQSFSPGLRGTSHPGYSPPERTQRCRR